jgi:uncharacterized LabA/DUF88 family protein
METIKDLRLAVLIDADNIPYTHVKNMLEEIAKYGTPTFKRIYADWTKPHIAGWKPVLLENAITPIQQYSYTTGKNSTDSAMIIDAMDILYTGRVDGFCIVSSDSDFTKIATRLREAGMKVFGLGEKKTPTPFISACDKFIYLEILKKVNKDPRNGSVSPNFDVPVPLKRGSQKRAGNHVPAMPAPVPVADTVSTIDRTLIKMIADSINDVADESGWAFLGSVGTLLLKKQPDFDPRNYGFSKLVSLIRNIDDFEIDLRKSPKNNNTSVYVREK